MKKKKKNKTNRKTLIVIILMLMFFIGIISFTNYNYSDKILPNIFISGESYSNLTKEEALNKLNDRTKDIRENGLTFLYYSKTYNIPLSELGIILNTETIIERAYNYGHKEDIIENIKDHFKLQTESIHFRIAVKIDEKIMDDYILHNLSHIEDPPKDFRYIYEDDNFIPKEAKSGIVIDRSELKTNISNNITNFQNDIIKLSLVERKPSITSDHNDNALLQANNLIKNKIILKYNSEQWEVQQADFALWIDFGLVENNDLEVKADHLTIEDYLLTIIPQINREPINAQLDFEDERIEMFSLSQEGIALQVEKSREEIDRAIFKKENYSDNPEKEITIEIEMITEKVQPEITTESIDNMGITSLLATGESNFYGSTRNRKHNIAVGAGKFQGILIGPGDLFSFNKVLGNVGPREGYLPELVIKKGETVPEYGGGLCQVSTTTFRGAVLAGLEVTERKNHAYAVKYYAPQGTDATIYPPHPDLQFKNNTPAYILIQTKIEGNKLYFDFYGSDDGRNVQMKGPVTYNWEEDGSMKSVWTQQVFDKNEELLFEKKFYSTYRSPKLYPQKNPLE
ncbi:MAG: VanW family protein [Candidatus Pacebacteria bacterium]|nr:VanW family protein [Candidatus Paceibacterota bacterium]